MDTKQVNYTVEQVAQIVEQYKAGVELDQIANTVGKTVRSVVAKLSREGVYTPKAKAVGAGRVTKEDLVAKIAKSLGFEQGALASLAKASKEDLELLASKF